MSNFFPSARIGILGDLFDPTTAAFGALDEYLAITGDAPIYAGLHTLKPTSIQVDNEVSYTGPYSRVQLVRNTALLSFTVDQVNYVAQNTNSIAWAPATAGSTVARWVSFGTKQIGAAGTHTIIGATPICAPGGAWIIANCTTPSSTDLVQISRTAHNANAVAEGDEIAVAQVYNGTLPAGLSLATPYFIKTGTLTVGADAVTFQICPISAAGVAHAFTDGWHFQFIKVVPLTIASPVIPTVGALTGYISVS